MNFMIFIILMTGVAVVNSINHEMGPTSATHEESKGANGPAAPRHECDQCSGRD
jgi:hypothetical protein